MELEQGAVALSESNGFDGRFALFVFLVAALAALVTSLVSMLGLKAWVMFLAWTAFGLGTGGIRGGIFAIISMLMGVIISMLAIIGFIALEPYTPILALPVAVFIAVVVVLCMVFTRPVDNIPACFLGLSTYFASDMSPDFSTFSHLSATILLGAIAAWLVVLIDRLCRKSEAD